MKVEDQRCATIPGTKAAGDIPCGTVFTGAIAGVPGVFMRSGQTTVCIVDLMNPSRYWTSAANIKVKDYQPVHGKIVIERNA